jgi:tetratricopeptide (TPR) repeat protein
MLYGEITPAAPESMFATSLLYLWAALLPPQAADTRPPPKRPSERFTVYVEMAPGFTSTPGGASAGRVLRSVSDKLKKRRNWFFVSQDSARAEVRVEVLGHRVRREHRTTLESRIRHSAEREVDDIAAAEYVDINYLSERHYLQARVTFLGAARAFAGHDGSERGASLEGAADHLAKEIEKQVKESYWDLDEERRQIAARGLDLPPPADVSAGVAEPAPPDPRFAAYRHAISRYRSGDFTGASESVSRLGSNDVYALGTLLLSNELTDAEWKAAAMLHTECVITLPQRAMNLIQLARRSSQHLELARRYSQAIGEPSERRHFQKRWHLAVAYYYLLDLQSTGVEAVLFSGLRSFPADPDLLFALGSFYEARGALRGEREPFVDAERVYRALASSASSPDLDVRLGHTLLRLGRTEEAETLLTRAPAGGIESDAVLATWLLRGEIARERGQTRTSLGAYQAALEVDRTCQACAVALATAYDSTGQRDKATRFVSEWLASPNPTRRDGWWCYLLGSPARFERLRDELRSEAGRP